MGRFDRLDELFRDAGRAAGRMLFPPLCVGCGRIVADGGVCGPCWSGLRMIEEPVCAVYGTPFAQDFGAGFLSARALADPPVFDRLRSAAVYTGIARDMVRGLKFNDRHHLAVEMARWMGRAGHELIGDADVITPLPLHWRRYLGRRFNQSALLAAELARTSGKPFRPDVLVRHRATRHQVGLSQRDREANVRNAFRVPDPQRIHVAGRRILLVDDVHTTGATVSAAAKALKAAGASGVDVLTFAMVLNHEA